MSVEIAGRVPATFEIKSANLPLVALLLKSPDLALLGEELAARFGDIPDFFDNDPLLLDLAPLKGEGEVDFRQLLELLKGYKVQPVAVKGGSEAQMQAAFGAGLIAAQDAREVGRAPVPAEVAAPVAEAVPAPAPTLPQGGREEIPPSAMVVDKPLRSGQQVYARGADLIVLAVVSFGAEVIADGSIHVYAPLRGRAIAGAQGDTQARIFAACMEPQLVSIAGTWRTTEAGLPPEVAGKPAQVRLDGDKLLFEPLKF